MPVTFKPRVVNAGKKSYIQSGGRMHLKVYLILVVGKKVLQIVCEVSTFLFHCIRFDRESVM